MSGIIIKYHPDINPETWRCECHRNLMGPTLLLGPMEASLSPVQLVELKAAIDQFLAGQEDSLLNRLPPLGILNNQPIHETLAS